MDEIRRAQQLIYAAVEQSSIDESEQILRAVIQDEATEPDIKLLAKDRLCLLLVQQARASEAIPIMTSMGYRYRLVDKVFAQLSADAASSAQRAPKRKRSEMLPVCVLDDGLPPSVYEAVLETFAPESSFWSDHNYSADPDAPSPYFSFVHQLPVVGVEQPSRGATEEGMERLIGYVRELAIENLPHLAKRLESATAAEWWAHCRPHNSGHQMHFDSANEGSYQGRVRHPIVSTVVYLNAKIGGATLVTDQTLKSTRLANQGWLVGPKQNRLCMFDGSVLHGVVPGCGLSPNPNQRRTTLMIAFWDHLACLTPDQGELPPYPNQPFPSQAAWAKPLATLKDFVRDSSHEPVPFRPVAITPVYVDVDEALNLSTGQSLTTLTRLPQYQTCFQGF